MVARPKEFDVDEALERAMDLFWTQGYRATTMQDLVRHLGIGRQSLYDTFGDKHRLFIAVLKRYRKLVEAKLYRLERASASFENLRRHFHDTIEFLVTQPMRRSCLITNATMELTIHDPDVAAEVNAHWTRVDEAITNVLERSLERGEIELRQPVRAVMRHLSTTVMGLCVTAKVGASRQSLREGVTAALSVVEEIEPG